MTTKLIWNLAVAMGVGVFGSPNLSAAVALFDFQDTGASKQPNFSTFSALSPSQDTDALSTTSLLSLSSPGFTNGGWNSYSLDDNDNTSFHSFDNTYIPGPATKGIGFNGGGASQTTPTYYLSFTVTPDASHATTYTEFSAFVGANQGGDVFDFALHYIQPGDLSSTLVESIEITQGPGTNSPISQVNFDIADFTSDQPTEWRLYAWNVGTVRFDDITLSGSTSVVPEPGSLTLFLLAVASLMLPRRRRKTSRRQSPGH